jgi:hypothetical protein
MERIERMFEVTKDVHDPRRPEIFVARADGSRWITAGEDRTLVINNKAEARALVEALMEITMTLSFTYEEEAEDA